MFGFSLIRTKKLMAIYGKIATFATERIKRKNHLTMTITGIITVVLPETSGVSRSSGKQWRKREAVVQYASGQYPKTIVFQMMNAKIDELNIQQGVEYDLEIDFDAREWNGRYFLQASCWKATPKNQPQQYAPQSQQSPPQYAPASQSATPTLDAMGVKGYQQPQQSAPQGADDLPF